MLSGANESLARQSTLPLTTISSSSPGAVTTIVPSSSTSPSPSVLGSPPASSMKKFSLACRSPGLNDAICSGVKLGS